MGWSARHRLPGELPGATSTIPQIYNPGYGSLASAATGGGVGNPLGEGKPAVTNGLTSRTDPAIEYARGFTDLNLGRFASAEEDFNKALRVDPNNPKTLFMLGEAKVALGELKGALGAFEKALKYDPGQITIRGEYAVVLARLGQADQAQAQLAILNARAVACGGSCPEADDFKAELDRIQAALSNPGKANSRHGMIMNIRSQTWAAVTTAALLLAPGWASAQAGMGAFDLEHGQKARRGPCWPATAPSATTPPAPASPIRSASRRARRR